MTLRSTALFTFLSIAMSGCAGCGDNGAIKVEEVPEEFSLRFCRSLFSCGSTPSVEACVASFDNSYYELVLQSIRDGKIIFDGDAAAECFDLLSSDACTVRTTQQAIDELFSACTAGFAGTVADGGDCLVLEECVSGLCQFSDDPDICALGTCAYSDGVDQDCTTTPCAYDAWCDSVDNTCKEFIAAGNACVPGTGSCAFGTLCDFQTTTCVAIADEGDDCLLEYGAASCARFDNYCDPTTETCTRRKDVGQDCDVETADCVVWARCNAGTCEALPESGEGCDPAVGCLGGLLCQGGVCVLPADPNCGG